jgi:multiple sugar transport system substrate-binding protein
MLNRKHLIFVVIFLFLLTLISNITFAETIQINLLTLFSGGEGYIMENLIDQFNKENPEIKVIGQAVDWGQYYNKLMTSILSGEPPDMGIMHLAVLPEYASRDTLTSIGEFVSEKVKKDYLENIYEAAYYKGKMYAIPIDAHPLVLYYNKKVLKEAGLTDKDGNPLVPKTLEELYDYAKVVKEKTGNWGLVLENGPMLGERWWIAVYTQLGGKLFDSEGNFVMDKQLSKEAWEILYKFFEEVAPNDLNYDDQMSLFNSDKAAFQINGVWAMSVFPDIKGLDFGVTLVPALKGKNPYIWADSHSFVFPQQDKKDNKKIEAAIKFANWFVAHSYEWAKAGHLPVIKSVRESEEFLSLPMRNDYMKAAEVSVAAPSILGWGEIREEMWEIGQAIVQDAISIDDGVDRLYNKIKEVTQ